MYCLQARPCIFKPGNFTDWGIEGVNIVIVVGDARCDLVG